MKSQLHSVIARCGIAILPAVLAFGTLVAPAPAQAETMCIRARTGSMYAVGEGYTRQECRSGDVVYNPAKVERDLSYCILDASPGRTNFGVCSCPEGEVVDMVGPYSVTPPGLLYNLVTSPASSALGEWAPTTTGDYSMVLTQLTADQGGSVLVALRCATY